MAESLALGVDVGGTKVAAGLVNREGHISRATRVPMTAHGTAQEGLACVLQAIEAVLGEEPAARDRVHGIGIGCPGPLDPEQGVVINPGNLPCWRNYPLAAEVARALAITTRLENDANAAALAEAVWGAGAGHRNIFYVTLGTGIGTGIVFDRRVYRGRTGSAGEGGHVTIDYRGPQCACGKRGCFEAFCSGPAIARRAQALLAESGADSVMLRLANNRREEIRAETVAQAFQQGDAAAVKLMEETAELTAVWLGNMIDLLEPDAIVLGGGVAQMLAPLLDRVRAAIPRWSINTRSGEIPLLLAKYRTDAGIAGAAAVAMEPAQGDR